MAANNIYIKDLPYEFLKQQKDGFFDTPEYTGFNELFDSKKVQSPLMPERDQAPPVPDEIVDMARLFVFRRYLAAEPLVQSESDLTGLIYVRMLTKVNVAVAQRRKLLKTITTDIASLPDEKPTTIRRIIDSSIVRQMKNSLTTRATASTPAVSGLRPEKTSNVVKDVVVSSKFYQSNPSMEVLDDVKHRTLKINLALQGSMIQDPDVAVSKEIFRDPFTKDMVYDFKYADLAGTVELVRSTVKDRYLSSFNVQANLTIDPQTLRNTIRMNARDILKDRPRYELYSYNTSVLGQESDEYTVHHRLGTTNFTSSALMIGREYLNGWAYPEGPDDAKVELPYSGHAVITLLSDNKGDRPPKLSDLFMTQDNVRIREFSFNASTRWQLDFEGLDDGFLLQLDIQEDPYDTPLRISVISTDRIVIEFTKPRSGRVYLLANSENTTKNLDIVVTNENVESVLAGFDFAKRSYKLWN